MKTTAVLIQIILAVMLMAAVLLQARGTGLGTAWGGSGSSYHSKRGIEKILFFATIVIAAFFLLVSILNLVVN